MALNEICNYHQVCAHIATSGQPTREQFSELHAAGYTVVVNLAMPSSTNWMADERDVVAALGMEYVPIPVVWEYPTLDDFEQLAEVLEQNRDRKVWVHCALNMRVSAMMYLYNRLRLGMKDIDATQHLNKIWVPNDIWQTFIEATLELYAE